MTTSTEANFYVYVYKDPDTLIPFYVGKGKESRYKSHINEAMKSENPRTHKLRKIKKILNEGKTPIIEKFQEGMTEDEAYDLEKHLISYYGRVEDGGSLTNVAEGGLRSAGGGNKFNDEMITLYHFDGSEITATRGELVNNYKFYASSVTRLFQGKLNIINGWSRDKNIKSKHRIYHFRNNKTNEQVLMRPSEFARYINISTSYVSKLINGENKHIRHWCIDYNGETETKDLNVYEFKNINTGEVVNCTIQQLSDELGIKYSMVDRVVNTSDHNRNIVRGWGLATKIDALPTKMSCQVDRKIYNFYHKDGMTFSGLQREFRKKYNIPAPQVSSLINSKIKSTFGWRLRSED
jgi:hypothetical protein